MREAFRARVASGQARGVLHRLPQRPGRSRPGRRPVGDLRRPRRLKAAIAKILGCSWQRCTVHFLCDCLGHARRDQHGLPLAQAALVRFNREIGRRTDVVGIFPDDQSLACHAGMLYIEQNDESLLGRAYLGADRSRSSSRDQTIT